MSTGFRVPALLLWFISIPTALSAQARVTGHVTDAFGDPIAFAEVFAESLRISTLTSQAGTYLLLVPPQHLRAPFVTVRLRVRSLGYRSEEAEFRLEQGQEVTWNPVLTVDPLGLDEIVVTGQGLEAKRGTLGTSISTVRSEDIVSSQEPNIVNALSAKAPNVEVTSTSGDPGAGSYLRIRGSRSIQSGSQPLFVVDGTPISNASDFIWDNPKDPNPWAYSSSGPPFENRAMDLNPHDIESIEILKGPAAASLYGSRAANGVVLITTKTGRPNTTRMSFSSSASVDRVTQLPRLQTRFGQGLDPSVLGEAETLPSPTSWGLPLDPGIPVYDHAGELFRTGYRTDNSLTVSGGTDRTTYYLSLGYLKHEGTIKGASSYERTSARLNGGHEVLDNLTVKASFAYSTSRGSVIESGNDLSGLLLGAFRTPPEFNNLPYLDPQSGLHRSYRCDSSCLEDPKQSRGYDNPFWVANEVDHDSDADRTFGNVTTDYAPARWLKLRHILGVDFSSDRRFSLSPPSSSTNPEGYMAVAELARKEIDHTLFATVTHAAGRNLDLELTLGQNINQAKFNKTLTEGFGLVENARRLDFLSDLSAQQYESTVRTVGYFGRLSAALFDELFLNGGLRLDGSDTFGGDIDPRTGKREPSRYWYPELSASWEFGRHLAWVDKGRVRVARGEAGTQPPAFSNVGGFEAEQPYHGHEAVSLPGTLPNTGIRPERTREWEIGADVAVWDNRLSVGLTRYWQRTTDAILAVPVAAETGYQSVLANGASWRNWGWEISFDLQPVATEAVTWTLGGAWGKNRSMVDELLGTGLVVLGGLGDPLVAVTEGEPFGILSGTDFVRFGRGTLVDGVDIDGTFGAKPGTLYIGEDGFPVADPQVRTIGDPNPDWTGSLRSLVNLWGKVRISALLDIKKGGDMWNGTRGALYSFGTHKETEAMHGLGVDTVFAGVGPGAGKTVTLNWLTWGTGLGGGFFGPSRQFVEDAGYVKLREITLSFLLGPRWLSAMGFEDLEVQLSGRNLITWTHYSGIDPESNLTGQTTARGLEFFNHPQTRSLVIGMTLRR